MHTFMLAMILYPHEFKKAQQEIDKVIGRNRLPNLDDRPSLPYLECVLKEVLRWALIDSSLNLAHVSTWEVGTPWFP